MHHDAFLYNSGKTVPRSVERGCWGRVQQPFCFLSHGTFFYLALIKQCEAWNHALHHSECSHSRRKSTRILHGCKGIWRQELHLPVPRKAKLRMDLLDICKKRHNTTSSWRDPVSILLSFSSPIFPSLFSIFFLLSKSLLLRTTLTPVHPPPSFYIWFAQK